VALGVAALLTAACSDAGQAPTTRDSVVFAWEAHCLVFLDETAALPISRPDRVRFGEVLAGALRPLMQRVYGENPLPIEDPALSEALERLQTGAASPDDLWAIDELGDMLVAAGAATCADLGRNLTAMPAPPAFAWDIPPETHIDSTFPAGTADEACDIFILTVNSWLDEIALGAEFGPSLAAATDALIADLEALGYGFGLGLLRRASEGWATLPWAAAAEAVRAPLEGAASALAAAAPRCEELGEALHHVPDPEATTTTVGDPGVYWDFNCRTAPPEQRTSDSSMPLALTPHPVVAGSVAALEVGARSGRTEDATGSWARWECWNGSNWVTTHLLEFGWDYGGQVVPGEPGVTWTIAGVGLWKPNTFWVTIPNVPPGWFRLVVEGGCYLAVEVVESG